MEYSSNNCEGISQVLSVRIAIRRFTMSTTIIYDEKEKQCYHRFSLFTPRRWQAIETHWILYHPRGRASAPFPHPLAAAAKARRAPR